MFPDILLCSMFPNAYGKKKKREKEESLEVEAKELQFWHAVHFNGDLYRKPARFISRSQNNTPSPVNGEFNKTKKKVEMVNKVSNLSDLIQRVTASCLLHPLAAGRQDFDGVRTPNHVGLREEEIEEVYENDITEEEEEEEEEQYEEHGGERDRAWREKLQKPSKNERRDQLAVERATEMESVMDEVFDAAAALKRAYVALQEAHSPWDPERMRTADMAVVAELRRIGVLRERFRRTAAVSGGRRREKNGGGGLLREVVAPYEAAVDELKMEVKSKDAEIVNLNEKLKAAMDLNNGGKKRRSVPKRKVCCSTQVSAAPAPELFEATMMEVKEASKSFTSLLLSLMRTARWDIAAAVRSIEAATSLPETTKRPFYPSSVAPQNVKYALESYISRKIFQGFDHETFYIDGSLSSLINPDQYRNDCFNQYRDMKSMDPVELLGILPTCHFGKFCSKKYLLMIHSKMEESLFGDLDQHRQVSSLTHPRTQFYGNFLRLAKAVWLLHLLAFSFDPSPSQFEASRGAEFHPDYMESVVKFSGGRVPTRQVVGFPVSPGFKFGNRPVIKAGVFLVDEVRGCY